MSNSKKVNKDLLIQTLKYKKGALEYIKRNGKLPISFKERWIEALRSGKYKQTSGELYKSFEAYPNTYGYCCLGVVCKVQGLTDKILSTDAIIGERITSAATKRKKGIPKILHGENPLVDFLIHCNDTRRLSFKQIANWVEINL